MRSFTHVALAAASLATSAMAITLDVTSADSVKSAAKTIAAKMVAFYPQGEPGDIPGILGDPYYWWEAGGMFGTLIDYWYYTGDDQYNAITSEALIFQVSPTYDYMPANQTKDEGNDDQIFWGFAVMTAAEYKFPNPPDGTPSWITIAASVFNSQALRWDTATCNGGLRWQIFTFNNGYDYKNSPSNAGMLNLAARLYAYTGNTTYSEWVDRTWNWMYGVGLIEPSYGVFDGTSTPDNCSTLDRIQWTYSAGMLLNAAAVMWNMTNSTEWEDRANGLWNATSIFFKDEILYEVACEPQGNCNTDQHSFKAYFIRFAAASAKWAPFLYTQMQPYISASGVAAAAQCSGGDDGETCGTSWLTNGVWDGSYGVGQQMCALEAVQANLIQDTYAPVTNISGGISHGNASLGTTGTGGTVVDIEFKPVTTGDRAGAAMLSILIIVAMMGGGYWIVS